MQKRNLELWATNGCIHAIHHCLAVIIARNISCAWYPKASKSHITVKQQSVLGKEGVSSNDINMAQAVCALAPLRMQPGDGVKNRYCRLALLVDQRGRGLPEDWFGNGVADINVQVPQIDDSTPFTAPRR